MYLSPLTRVVIEVVELARPGSPPVNPAIVEEAVTCHGMNGEAPPAWPLAWFRRIATRQPVSTLFEVPDRYPDGDQGVVNLLLDIEQAIGPLGVTDVGESLEWIIPGAGLRVLTLRETARGGYYGAIRPLGSDVNGWLRGQYKQLSKKNPLSRLS